MADDVRANLLVAWELWDAHCTRVHADPKNHNKEPMGCPTTIRMEEACQAYAESFGLECSVFRARLSASRRSGLSREESLSD